MRLQLQKERLMAFVVHDLKNPVNAMDLHAQLLLRNPSVEGPVRDSVQRIREEARSLTRMLLNLLDISKSEEGQLTARLGPVQLYALARDLIEACAVKAAAVGASVVSEVELEGPIQADADLLRRVLENLLDNALRHAPEGSVVKLQATQSDDAVILRVADQGVGLSAEQKEKVFERYAQIEHGHRVDTRAGRGLGLTFCRLAIEAHGGTITIEDGNPGAVFQMRLPR